MPQIYLSWQRLEGADGHLAGRQLLETLYRTHAGSDLPPILIAPGGKPCFANSPWHFSISHSKRHAFCVLADLPVGLDAEESDRPISLALADKILSAGELAQFRQATDPRQALLRFWVLKEAAGKLTGQGIRFHPRHTDFSLADNAVTEIDGCYVAILY